MTDTPPLEPLNEDSMVRWGDVKCLVDWHRDMARRFAEDRDELKHQTRQPQTPTPPGVRELIAKLRKDAAAVLLQYSPLASDLIVSYADELEALLPARPEPTQAGVQRTAGYAIGECERLAKHVTPQIAHTLTMAAATLRGLADECLRLSSPAPLGEGRAQSAGDVFLAATSAWMEHGPSCEDDTCRQCDILINHMRMAEAVWRKSAHKSPTQGRAQEEPTREKIRAAFRAGFQAEFSCRPEPCSWRFAGHRSDRQEADAWAEFAGEPYPLTPGGHRFGTVGAMQESIEQRSPHGGAPATPEPRPLVAITCPVCQSDYSVTTISVDYTTWCPTCLRWVPVAPPLAPPVRADTESK